MSNFSIPLLTWFDVFGRHDLPWQKDISAYRVWVSEIMLQQTQVKTVIPYYERFMHSFPSITALAEASQERVLAHWAGLGYYARGRNLHKAAQQIMTLHDGQFPQTFADIVALPGIGRSTAGAILAIALQQRFPILDGNVKRVLSRYFALQGWPGEKSNELFLWQQADKLTPEVRFADYTQAIMDLGATLCTRTRPKCNQCPVSEGCQAKQLEQVSLFPQAKPQKNKPIKQTYFVMLENEKGQILLQQRPQKGIWGGLWSFPEEPSFQACLQSLSLPVETLVKPQQSLVEWQSFRHSFTHYHLDIFPIYGNVGAMTNLSYEGVWMDKQRLLDEKLTLGMPAPVIQLLKRMEK